MSKINLSVCLATFNEEKNIGFCLRSVMDIADEIVVVDGNSTDKTIHQVKKFIRFIRKKKLPLKVKLIQASNQPMFHKNKQLAVDKTSGEWILQLDADERVSPELKKEIQSAISNQQSVISNFSGYFIPRKNYFLGRWLAKGGQYPDYVTRLFKKGRGLFPCKSVHEQIKIKGKVGYLKNDLLHYSDPTLAKYIKKLNHYTNLDAQELKKRKRTGFLEFFDYVFLKPAFWFLGTFFRHKGFLDSWQGFLFALFSSLRFPVTFFKAKYG